MHELIICHRRIARSLADPAKSARIQWRIWNEGETGLWHVAVTLGANYVSTASADIGAAVLETTALALSPAGKGES